MAHTPPSREKWPPLCNLNSPFTNHVVGFTNLKQCLPKVSMRFLHDFQPLRVTLNWKSIVNSMEPHRVTTRPAGTSWQSSMALSQLLLESHWNHMTITICIVSNSTFINGLKANLLELHSQCHSCNEVETTWKCRAKDACVSCEDYTVKPCI